MTDGNDTDYGACTVGLNPMVYRQTAGSKFSHFVSESGDSFEELLKLIAACLAAVDAAVTVLRKEDGRIISLRLPEPLCQGRFFSSIVKLEAGMTVRSVVGVRPGGLPGELPYIQSVVVGAKKTPTKWVDVILYHRDALEIAERTWTPPGASEPVTVDADWQVISVNAHIRKEGAPLAPPAMARNHAKHFDRPEGVGGTARQFTGEDYMESLLFWNSHAMVAGEDEE
ncbi:MAG: DUF3228 family protein [Candidatus Melainabacteria bacterium]|jgi:hypothetical protein|nr:DUF3228 family protein [Candidatus Melainabacteria bacterium]